MLESSQGRPIGTKYGLGQHIKETLISPHFLDTHVAKEIHIL
jgi:hypothetical protein